MQKPKAGLDCKPRASHFAESARLHSCHLLDQRHRPSPSKGGSSKVLTGVGFGALGASGSRPSRLESPGGFSGLELAGGKFGHA